MVLASRSNLQSSAGTMVTPSYITLLLRCDLETTELFHYHDYQRDRFCRMSRISM